MPIVVKVKTNTKEVEKMLGRMRIAVRDRKGLLQAWKEWLILTTRRSFQNQRSPEGKQWASLSPTYARNKPRLSARRRGGRVGARARGLRILEFTGALFNSIMAGVTQISAFVESRLPYAAAHQFGASYPPMVIRPKRAKVLAFLGSDGTMRFAMSVKIGPRTLKARPFLPSRDLAAKNGARIAEQFMQGAINGRRQRVA